MAEVARKAAARRRARMGGWGGGREEVRKMQVTGQGTGHPWGRCVWSTLNSRDALRPRARPRICAHMEHPDSFLYCFALHTKRLQARTTRRTTPLSSHHHHPSIQPSIQSTAPLSALSLVGVPHGRRRGGPVRAGAVPAIYILAPHPAHEIQVFFRSPFDLPLPAIYLQAIQLLPGSFGIGGAGVGEVRVCERLVVIEHSAAEAPVVIETCGRGGSCGD